MAQPDKNRSGIPSDIKQQNNRDRQQDAYRNDNPGAVQELDQEADRDENAVRRHRDVEQGTDRADPSGGRLDRPDRD